MIQGLKACKNPIGISLQLERGKFDMVQKISKIRLQREQSSGSEVLLAPCRVLEAGRTHGSVTTTFVRKRGPDRQVRGCPKAVITQDGGNLVCGTYCTLVQERLIRFSCSLFNRTRRARTSAFFLRHCLKLKGPLK